MFDQYYPTADGGPQTADSGGPSSAVRGLRSYVEAMGELGNQYWWQYEGGNRDVIVAIEAEEANLLHARQLARKNGWWDALINTMQGLQVLYDHTGRRAEWMPLVDEIVPDLVDPQTGGPLPGHEEQWSFVTGYRVLLARHARQWAEAERLQRVRMEWERQRAAAALATLRRGVRPDALDAAARNAIRSLAMSLEQLGNVQREQGKPDCVTAYEEAVPLCQRIGDKPEEAIIAFNLGHAYKDILALRDLDEAGRWYRRSLELFDERDRLGRGRCLSQLGYVAWEHFKEARAANQPADQLAHHLQTAAGFYYQAIDLLPPNDVDDLAVMHSQLGDTYDDAGDLDRALLHYREAIRYFEIEGNLYLSAQARFSVAVSLFNAGRLDDAMDYARAALRGFSTYGDRAHEELQRTQQLMQSIQSSWKQAEREP
jgi:tetratricopeptide (TPR) repeat protein